MAARNRVASWWTGGPTLAGNPASLYLDPGPGGCLGEKLPGGGGVANLRVTYFEPGKILIFTGAMGPLLHEAVNGVLIVNAARGGLVDEQALADAVRAGQVGGAGIAVFGTEPCPASPLAERHQVRVTPASGAAPAGAQGARPTRRQRVRQIVWDDLGPGRIACGWGVRRHEREIEDVDAVEWQRTCRPAPGHGSTVDVNVKVRFGGVPRIARQAEELPLGYHGARSIWIGTRQETRIQGTGREMG